MEKFHVDMARLTQRLQQLKAFPDYDLTLVLVAIATMLVLGLMLTTIRPHLIPPGPRLVPLIGNLHLLWDCDDVRAMARDLRHQYGDIYSLYFGRQLVVVINGMRLMREAFFNNGGKLAHTPSGCKEKGILNSNGRTWRRCRRLVHLTFGDLGINSDVLEAKIAPEMIQLASTLIDHDQQPFNPADISRKTVFNVIFSVVLGERFPWDQPETVALFDKLTDVMADKQTSPMTSHYWSWKPRLSWKRFKGLDKTEEEIRRYIRRCIKNRLQALDDEALCFADAYLLEMRDEGMDDTTLNSESLVHLTMDLLFAGTESLASTLQWLLLYLACNQDCQTKAHLEVDSILGGSFPVWADIDRLPYLEALISESQRLADVKPFSRTHVASETLVLEGFNIPAKALVVPNITSVLYDETLFPEPELFKPDRFLGRRGERLKRAGFIPFFMGKRMCVGQHLARMELFLLTAAMIQHFRFVFPEDTPPPSLRGIMGLTRRPCPFKVIARRRTQML